VLKLRGDDLTIAHFRQLLNMLGNDQVWNDAELWQSVTASLPGYRLSKFQPLMPDWVEQEVVADYVLNRGAAKEWILDASPSS